MIRTVALLLALTPALAFAQGMPEIKKTARATGSVAQANTLVSGTEDIARAMMSKADTTNGTLTSPTITGGTVTGAGIVNGAPSTFVGSTNNPMTDSTAHLSVRMNGSATADQIYSAALGCVGAGYCYNGDAIRGAATATPGSTIVNVNGVAGYVMNRNPTSGNGQNSVALFGAAVGAVNGSYTWGLNTLLTDNTAQTASSGTGRLLQNELDFNVTSPDTTISGLLLAGASLAQPKSASGFTAGGLGKGIKWGNAFASANGAANTALFVGTLNDPSTANSLSQPIAFVYTDANAAQKFYTLYATPGAMVSTGPLAVQGYVSASNGANISGGALNIYGTANNMSLLGAVAGNSPVLTAFGADNDINIAFNPKNNGTIVVGGALGVSCAAGSVSLSTFTVTKGIVTHC